MPATFVTHRSQDFSEGAAGVRSDLNHEGRSQNGWCPPQQGGTINSPESADGQHGHRAWCFPTRSGRSPSDTSVTGDAHARQASYQADHGQAGAGARTGHIHSVSPDCIEGCLLDLGCWSGPALARTGTVTGAGG
jgi:hypothetical protein